MYFLNTIQIILVLAAGAFSQETSGSETSQSTECYGKISYQYHPLRRFVIAIVDDSGHMCYSPIRDQIFSALFTKTSLDEAFANASSAVCSSWASSKKCLSQHLNKKCPSDEVKQLQEQFVFNEIAAATELVCSPSKDYNLLNMFKEAAVDGGLGDCLSRFSQDETELEECIERSLAETNDNIMTVGHDFTKIPFKKLVSSLFQCAVEPIKNCAGDDKINDILALWARLEKAVYFGHDSFWSQVKPPPTLSTILDLLK